MSLMTWEEEEALRRIRHLDERIEILEMICLEILERVKPPSYAAPAGISFTPSE
jgi:hypothetical protein